MSGLNTLTVASPPTTAEVAADLAAWLGGQSGVLTDLNQGSQVRTDGEALGSVVEMQSVIAQAQAFQAIVYSAWSAFNIFPLLAVSAVADVTFLTGTGVSPPTAPTDILIPAGTVLQTVGGIQFATVANVTLLTGGTSVDAVVQAVVPGLTGNVAAGSITQIASALAYPLSIENDAPATGGTDAESPAQTMSRFTAAVAKLGRATPVAVANAAIGVTVPGTTESVEFSTCFEPWIAQAAAGAVSGFTIGFTLYVDNGSGSASSNLLTAVQAVLDGNQATGDDGYRPAGVPESVQAVNPLFCSVVVSGTAVIPGLDAALTTATETVVTQYFNGLAFGEPAESTQLIAVIANQVAGNITSLGINLLDNTGATVPSIQPTGIQRMILQTLNVNYT